MSSIPSTGVSSRDPAASAVEVRSNPSSKQLISSAGSHFMKEVRELGRTFMSAARAAREGGASGADIARLLGRGLDVLRKAMIYAVDKVLVGLSHLAPKRDLDENVPPGPMARLKNPRSIPLVRAVYFEQGTEFDSVPSTPDIISGDGAEPTTSDVFKDDELIKGDEYSRKSDGRPALTRSAAVRFNSDSDSGSGSNFSSNFGSLSDLGSLSSSNSELKGSEFPVKPLKSILKGQAKGETDGLSEAKPARHIRFADGVKPE